MGRRLRLFIEGRGQTIRDFERESGVPYKTLQQYLAGRRYPGGDHLAKMAEIGVDLNWLLTGKVSGELWFKLRDVEPLPEEIGAFPFLHQVFLVESIKLVDECHHEQIKDGFAPLTLGGLVKSVWLTLSVFGTVLEGHADKVVEMVGMGWPPEKIAEMFVSPIRGLLKERMKRMDETPPSGDHPVS